MTVEKYDFTMQGMETGGTGYVDAQDFDRLSAERDQLQRDLNARDEEVGRLRLSERRLNWLLNECKEVDIVAGLAWLASEFGTIERSIDELMGEAKS